MAHNLLQFDIDDDSPEIAYFPFVNLEPSPNVTAGWQLLYSGSGAATIPGQVGVGTSYHYTSLNGASLMISWTGTGIDLLGTVSTNADTSYNISVDGLPSAFTADPANTILASFNDLPNTNHSLLLTTIITNAMSPDAFLTFDKARVTYSPPAGIVNTTATSQTIADSDIAFMGLWSYVADSTGNSMHVSSSAGDRAETTFLGSAITIYGLTSSSSGKFSVTLDNITTTLSALSSYNNSDSLLFYATDLPQDTSHQITVINQENCTFALRLGGVNITSFGNGTTTTSPTNLSSSDSIPAGTIAAAVLAAVLFLVIVGIFYYACWVRRKARAINQHAFLFPRKGSSRFDEKGGADVERFANIGPSSREELESTSLSTSKGYGFGLDLRRGFPFAYRKNKVGSSSSGRSRNGNGAQVESHPMTPQYDRDEKRVSLYTLSENLPHVPESEKLAPGWCNPVASPSFKYAHRYKESRGILLPGLRAESMGPIGDDDDDDADVKTLTSRQDETLAATLSLSPRTAEAPATFDVLMPSQFDINAPDSTGQSQGNQQPEFLHVRDISPFRVDMAAIFGTRRGNGDSRRTSGSGGSSWSKVRSRLYRKAHRDDGRQSRSTDRHETSSSSGPESVPVVMHESGSAGPPSETAPGSGTYSFLDFTSSHPSLRRHSKTTTLSSTPAESGHGTRDAPARSENTSVGRVDERSRHAVIPKPDAPSTVSGGSHPSDNSGTHTVLSAPTTQTQRSPTFPFPITIPPSTHITPATVTPSESVPERHITLAPSSPHTPPAKPDQYLQVPQITPPELALTSASSPTESVPFSVSDIHFRHSASDYAGLDSQRGSVSSVLPPHPPLPYLDGSQTSTPTYSPPPPYIVRRVLGLPMSPLSPLSSALTTAPRRASGNPGTTIAIAGRSGTAPTQPALPHRVGSLLGPRPRPSTVGSIRGAAPPQLPMQGGRGSSRGQR